MAKAKVNQDVVNSIVAKAGNIPSVDDLMKITDASDVDGGYDLPEHPDRHYICIEWSSPEEARRQIRVIQSRLKSGYLRDPDHPLANDFTVLMYTSVDAFSKRQRQLSDFAEHDPAPTDSANMSFSKKAIEQSPDVEEAMRTMASISAKDAASEDNI